MAAASRPQAHAKASDLGMAALFPGLFQGMTAERAAAGKVPLAQCRLRNRAVQRRGTRSPGGDTCRRLFQATPWATAETRVPVMPPGHSLARWKTRGADEAADKNKAGQSHQQAYKQIPRPYALRLRGRNWGAVSQM